MIYKADYGPTGLRLWTAPGVRVFLGVVTAGAAFVLWFVFEPSLTFRAVDAVVVGHDVARVALRGNHSSFTEYEPEVFFRYEVAGVRYMGRKYTRINLEGTSSTAVLLAGSNQRGTSVTAWYNPLRPSEAVLSREADLQVVVWTCFALLTCWLGCSRRMLRAEPPSPSPIE